MIPKENWRKSLTVFVILLIEQSSSEWTEIASMCPNQCVCQHAHLNDLSIARWTSNFDNILNDNENLYTSSSAVDPADEQDDDNANGNEAFYENDSTHLNNPIIKFIMCFLQQDTNVKVLLSSIPQDVEALTLLYTGTQNNYTVQTSDIVNLPDLEILEIRGNANRDLHLVIDMAMAQIKSANFESITIYSSDSLKRRNDKIDPSQYFDYTPENENNTEYHSNVSLAITQKDQIEIVPYEIYLMQLRKTREISFYGWTNLNVLRIHECKLDELHWEIFDGLDNVKHLSLEHNNIKIIPPFSFFGVPNLKTLSLAHNEILDLHYRALAGLLELISLDMSHNNLTKLSELTFPPFPKLKIVDLRDNPVRMIYPYTFSVMNDTRKLSIGSSEHAILKIMGKETFKPLKQLKYLSIKNCNVPSITQETFHNLKSLEILRITDSSIKTIEFDAFTENLNLKQLFITNCGIEELSMDAFYGLSQIEIIDLSHNNILIMPPGIFDDKPRLKEIYLQYNQLESLPTNFFSKNLLNVKLVRLTNNPWFCTCEMMNWNQEITNTVRSGFEMKQCHGKGNLKLMENCNRNEYKYVYNNKMTPRCDGGPDNAKHRSVYYSIRRTLNCKPIVTVLPKPKPTMKKPIPVQPPNYDKKMSILKSKQLRAQDQRHQMLVNRRSNDPDIRKLYNSEKSHHYQHKFLTKYEKTIGHDNNLHYQLDLIDKRKPNVRDRPNNSFEYDKNSIL